MRQTAVPRFQALQHRTLTRTELDRPFSFGTGVTFPQYDVAPDGRFVMIRRDADFGRLSIVLNWTEELKRLTGK